MRILYQFPISHYCEKTRWQLEHKGLDYRTRNLLPGPHRLRTQWLARINTLPILRDGDRTVGIPPRSPTTWKSIIRPGPWCPRTPTAAPG